MAQLVLPIRAGAFAAPLMTQSKRTKYRWLTPAILLFLVFAVFSEIPQHGFVQWDDDINIYGNPHHGGLSWHRIQWMFSDTHYVLYYAPLSWLTLSAIYEVFGLNPFGYHLTSLLLHGTNAVLSYYLLRALLSCRRSIEDQPDPTALSFASGIGAAIWALHPLRVEPVAWATGISYLLAGFFALSSTLCFLHARTSAEGRRGWLVGSVGLFACSVLSYPATMALPFAFLIFDLTMAKLPESAPPEVTPPVQTNTWLTMLPFCLISAGVLCFTLYRRGEAAGLWHPPAGLDQFGIRERIMQGFYVWAWYLCKEILPLSLAPVYTRLVSFHATDWPFVASAILILGISIFLFARMKQSKSALALWLTYLVLLIPLLGLTEHPHNTADRYSYIASLAVSVAIGWILLRSYAKPKYWAWAKLCSCALLLCLGSVSFVQARTWRDSITLFSHVLTTIGSHSYRADIQMRLGAAFAQSGNLDAAESNLRASLQIDPRRFETHAHLAAVLAKRDRVADALLEYNAALAVNPQYTGGLVQKGALLYRQGETTLAIQALRDALARDPKRSDAMERLAWVRATDPDPAQRNGQEALSLALAAAKLSKYEDRNVVRTLSAAYAETGHFDLAIEAGERALAVSELLTDHKLALQIQQMLGTFKRGEPFRNHDILRTASPESAEAAGPPQ
jgi:tetratricopeptide (TPR) repeat protein